MGTGINPLRGDTGVSRPVLIRTFLHLRVLRGMQYFRRRLQPRVGRDGGGERRGDILLAALI